MSDTKNYDAAFESLLINILISNTNILTRAMGIIKPDYFDEPTHRAAVTFVLDYCNEHSTTPAPEQIKVITGAKVELLTELANTHDVWALQEIEEFCKYKALRDAILSSPALLDDGRYGEVETAIKAAVQIALVRDLGTDYFENPKARLEAILSNNGQVSTGWKTMDEKLHGGVNRGELLIVAGQSGAGKSIFLQNFAVSWAQLGLNVVYLSLELSENLCALRIDAMNTGYETREVMRNIDNVHMKLRLAQQKHNGLLRIKQMPNGCTANDIRAFIKEYEIHSGTKVDAMLIDYLDLMSPISKKISAENLFIKDKYVTEELRNLAVELDILAVSASQLNRCLSPDTLLITESGDVALRDIKVGDYILSESRYNQVIDKWSGKQQTHRITMKSGNSIICSAHHRFPSPTGITSIECGLASGSELYVLDGEYTTTDTITDISYHGEIETIDITTDGDHLFFGNGILTHNTSYDDEVTFDASHIAGGISKVNTADNVIGIFTNPEMKERGRYQIQFMKTRSSSGVGSKLDLTFNTKSLRIHDLEEDELDGAVNSALPAPKQWAGKQTPTAQQPTALQRATALRDLINKK